MTDVSGLEELRLIFRGEVEDHVATLEREAERLMSGLEDALARQAAREIYRAVHTLKGASRAVELPALEAVCHELESRLGSGQEAPPELAVPIARALARALRHWLESGDEEALKAVLAADLSPAALPPAQPPAPASEAAVSQAAESTQEEPVASLPGRAPVPRDTTRVSVAKLGDIAEASEQLLGLSSRSVYDSKPVEDTLSALRNDLARVRDAVRRSGAPEAAAATERALATVQTLRLLMTSDRERVDTWRRSIALGARELVSAARELRVVPLSALAAGVQRATEELAVALDKTIDLELDLERAEVDRTVRDVLKDVLLQLVRNAVDHGIESRAQRIAASKPTTGRIRVSAEVLGRELRVTVEDDGRGLHREALLARAKELGRPTEGLGTADTFNLIFEPGFTTATAATAVSGRGMGLDIVRQRVGQLHGRVTVESLHPSGTRFRLLVPVDLSVLRGLLVRAGESVAVLPTTAIRTLRRVPPDSVRSIEGRAYVDEADSVLPLVRLATLLRWDRGSTPRTADWLCYAVVGAGDRSVALEVDAFADERELVVRRPSPRLRRVPFLAGVTILDASAVAVVLDVHDLITLGQPRNVAPAADSERRTRALVVDDSITTRQLVRSILEAAGYDVRVGADGEQAWNMLQDTAVDVVVSDVDMPRVDGFQLLARIRNDRRLSKLPVILVTALAQEADRQRAFELGASAYIVKLGFDQDELLSAIEGLVE